VELETLGDDSPEERIIDRLLGRAIHVVFPAGGARRPRRAHGRVRAGAVIETGSRALRDYVRWTRERPADAVARLGVGIAAGIASAVGSCSAGLPPSTAEQGTGRRRQRRLPRLMRDRGAAVLAPSRRASAPCRARSVAGGPCRHARWDGRQRIGPGRGWSRRALRRSARELTTATPTPPGAACAPRRPMGDDLRGIEELLEQLGTRRELLERYGLGDIWAIGRRWMDRGDRAPGHRAAPRRVRR
jgi:hypothetical protein